MAKQTKMWQDLLQVNSREETLEIKQLSNYILKLAPLNGGLFICSVKYISSSHQKLQWKPYV